MSRHRLRVLVVEDEMLVAMLLEDMLTELGYEVVGPAMRLEAAISLAKDRTFDIAVLDINLGGQQSFPVADVLLERGIPYVFATGYGIGGLRAPHQNTTTLSKPFQSDDLRRAFARVLEQ